ncbi:hypothetical protein Ccrd_021298 [Cynara cardunculus var. scolymus]|uniref:ARGOS-like protein n=1 Tax=Cynara cardunculus var. scolymus TaxID=59895 RepID=A0A118K0F9_CYNCS|nr:hypothetical protein Ccrd_021298 [Cynara cardunculus var. scolymus]
MDFNHKTTPQSRILSSHSSSISSDLSPSLHLPENSIFLSDKRPSSLMEVRRMNMNMKMNPQETGGATMVVQQGRHTAAEHGDRSSLNNNNFGARRMMTVSKPKSRSSYFSIESMVLLVGLAASLLILPLILPPLPPPPLMLLLLPIFIFGVLMVSAFLPSFSNSSTARQKANV